MNHLVGSLAQIPRSVQERRTLQIQRFILKSPYTLHSFFWDNSDKSTEMENSPNPRWIPRSDLHMGFSINGGTQNGWCFLRKIPKEWMIWRVLPWLRKPQYLYTQPVRFTRMVIRWRASWRRGRGGLFTDVVVDGRRHHFRFRFNTILPEINRK